MEPKKLYRDTANEMVCGVCAGLAEYFNLDVTIVRLIAVLMGLASGSGLLLYIIAAIIVPVKPYV